MLLMWKICIRRQHLCHRHHLCQIFLFHKRTKAVNSPTCVSRCVNQCCVPMSSAKPPTGSRQVPVTNWRRRILFSLSISFTTCRNTTPSLTGQTHLSAHTHRNTYTSSQQMCVCSDHALCPLNHGVSLPARTSGSACCSWCNVCRWCSSASRPNRSPASHTASAATNKMTFTLQSVQMCVLYSSYLCLSDSSVGRALKTGKYSMSQTNLIYR